MVFKKVVLSLLFLAVGFVSNAQCAMCKAVVESGDNSMAEGLNGGIMYLMVFPYLLVGVLIYFLIRRKRRSEKLTS
ncbi:MAG: hypothetical protein ACPGRE_09515 [Flavobacteriaceae bacterium]